MIDAVEYCKQHDGTVTAKNIETLKSITESEIIAETIFSEEQIRMKHKVGWKFVKFTSRYLYHFW